MSSLDMTAMAFRNLFKRKLRTFLTVFSVIIGMCAIIVLVSLGIGMDKNMTESLGKMSDLLTVNVNKPWSGMVVTSGGVTTVSDSASRQKDDGRAKLDDNAVAAFSKIKGVIVSTPLLQTYVTAASGKYVSGLQITGVAPEAIPYLGVTFKEGHTFDGEGEFEAIFAYEAQFDFYNPMDRDRVWSWWSPSSGEPDTRQSKIDILNDEILFSFDWSFGQKSVMNTQSQGSGKPMKPFKLKPVGVLNYSNSGNFNYGVIMPLKDAIKLKQGREKWEKENYNQQGGSGNRLAADEEYDTVVVRFSDVKYVVDGLADIRNMGYDAWGMAESLNEIKKLTGSIQIVLAIVGAVALFIATIGIANTMFMSTYERTREIGIMKVIGATLSDIRRLFLFEAGLIGLLGGVLGIGVSFIISLVINKIGIPFFDQLSNSYGNGETPDISQIPLWLCLFSSAGAIFVGVLSGFFPARRAMKISALAAIRAE